MTRATITIVLALLQGCRGFQHSANAVSAARSCRRQSSIVSKASSSATENDPMDAYDQAASKFNSPDTTGSDQDNTAMKSDHSESSCPPNNNKSTMENPEEMRTLYDVLETNSDATKEKIKRKYILLAKQSHPDAAPEEARSDLDFAEIASAYRVLSDRRERQRYDRKLKAEAFSQEMQKSMEDFTDMAAPQVKKVFDNVALPFLRRTTATTLASIQSAARELSRPDEEDTETADLGSVFAGAMEAAQRAGKLVDNLEIMEKSEDVAERLLQQIKEANKIKSELDGVTMQRLQVSLHVPNTTFTSADAVTLLHGWNMSTSRSVLGLALNNPADKKIQELETVEVALVDKELELDAALSCYKRTEKEMQASRAERVLALQAEKRAREALARAKRRVADSKSQVSSSTNSLSRAATGLEKLVFERERLAVAQTRQQDDVRSSMQRREASVTEYQAPSDGADLSDLQRKEQALVKEYNALEIEATRLQSRANKLKDRAELLKSIQ